MCAMMCFSHFLFSVSDVVTRCGVGLQVNETKSVPKTRALVAYVWCWLADTQTQNTFLFVAALFQIGIFP